MRLMGMKDKAGGGGREEKWKCGGSADRLFSSFLQTLPSGRKVSQTPESTVWRNAWHCQRGLGGSLTASQDTQTKKKVAPPDFSSSRLPLRKIFLDKFIIFLL